MGASFSVCAWRSRVSRTAAMPERRSCRSARSSSTRFMRVSCFAIDEIAVEGELPDERIDLAERQRHRRPAFEVAAQEAIGRRRRDRARPCAASSTTAGPCFFASASTPRMRRTPAAPSCWWMCVADGADVTGRRVVARREQRQRARRRARRPVVVVRCDASRAARADARAGAGRSSDRAGGRAGRSTAPATRRPIQPGGAP